MAYIDFLASDVQALAPRHDPVPAPPEATLSALEWSVVAVARGDRLSSLREPSRLSIALGTVFGGKPNPRLADTRLEALRRMAVLSWHYGYVVASTEIRAFEAAGYSLDQYEILLASISVARVRRNTRGQA